MGVNNRATGDDGAQSENGPKGNLTHCAGRASAWPRAEVDSGWSDMFDAHR
jgi:hypothetical protein